MNNLILVHSLFLLIFEVVTLGLSYKFKGFKFTTHTFLFRITFIGLLIIYFYNQEPFVIALAMTSYFIINFFQDVFFHKYYYTELNSLLLISYLIAFLIGVLMIIFRLYFYTVFLNLVFSIIGVLISARNKSRQL